MALLTGLYTVPALDRNGVQTGRSCKFQTLLKRRGKQKKICWPSAKTQQKCVIMRINVHCVAVISGLLLPEVIKAFFCSFIAHLHDDFLLLSESFRSNSESL